MGIDLTTLKKKVDHYKEILENTKNYREDWKKTKKPLIVKTLKKIVKDTKIDADIVVKDQIENLEAIVFDLGRAHSGMKEKVEDSDISKTIIKTQGAIVYQQLFNGKIMVMFIYPYIEGYGEPKPPKNIEILRPHELSQDNIIEHVEGFLDEITQWEDFDDDVPTNDSAIYSNPIGFKHDEIEE